MLRHRLPAIAATIFLSIVEGCSRGSAQKTSAFPSEFSGTFHLRRSGEIDAINFEVSERGWRATLCGCDSARDLAGIVTFKDGKVRLVPPAGESTFHMLGVSKGWMPLGVREAELTPNGDGSLTAAGKDGDVLFQLRLEKGRMCAVCNPDDFPDFSGGPTATDGGVLLMLGPHGLHSCEAPVPADPCAVK